MGRRLSEQVVVITGASSGIGRATALRLARRGTSLVLAARREEPLESLARECQEKGADCLVVPTDVSDAYEVQALAEAAVQRFGRIDGWVNDAGVYMLGRLEETPLSDFHRLMDINFFGVVHGTRAAAAQLRSQGGGGVIVNVSSELATISGAYTSAYTASKHAVRGFTSAVRQELLGTGIELCTVMPAGIDTPLFEHAANYAGPQLKPPAPTYTPEKVARTIVRMLRRPRPEVSVGSTVPVFSAFRRVAPGAFDRVMRRQMESGAFQSEPAHPTQGNLYRPIPGGTGVHGGWHSHLKQWSRRLALFGVVAFGLDQLRRRALA